MSNQNNEFKLENLEEGFRIIFENTILGVYIADTKGNILTANKTLLRLLGSPSLEATKKINLLKFKPLIDNGYSALYKKCIETNKTLSFEIKYKSLWGKEAVFFTHIIPQTDANGVVKYVYTIMNDITKDKNREENILINQRLESIGLLAGGIAHDFNNLLNGVFGNLSLIKYFLEEGHPALELLKTAELSIERAKALTKQLLIFSKGGEPILEILSMDEFIKSTVSFHLSGSNVKAIFDIDENIKKIRADKGQIEQVISNIVINAIQAMPNGGTLYINLSNEYLSDDNIMNLTKGEYLKLSIKDTGIGIDKEKLSHIFEPYFTTKGQGSGLGLATSYSIIRKHKGGITVVSEKNKFTQFDIYLPTVNLNSNTKLVNKTENLNKKLNTKKLNILIMDDEYIIRKLLIKMLNFLGHRVVATSTGEEAIEEYIKSIESNDKFDLLITDLTVPGGLGGKETAQKILEINPNIKCIVSSGYSNDPIMANYQDYGFVAVLEKPYTIEILKEVIERI